MKPLLILFLSLLTCSAFAKAEHSCFNRHLTEASALNAQRKFLYSELSGGQSIAVSDALITFEKDLLRQANLVDIVAYPYQVAGIPIVCEDFVSMANTPAFKPRFAQGAPSLEQFHPASLQVILPPLREALKEKDFVKIVDLTSKDLAELEKEPRFNCLVRHFLESIRRIADLAPRLQAEAKAKLGFGGTLFLSRKMLQGHLDTLEEAARIDVMAAPVQALDVPIICQDVPPIPTVKVLFGL